MCYAASNRCDSHAPAISTASCRHHVHHSKGYCASSGRPGFRLAERQDHHPLSRHCHQCGYDYVQECGRKLAAEVCTLVSILRARGRTACESDPCDSG